jgi:hypothetical protein
MKKRESRKGSSRNRVKIEVPVSMMKNLIAYLFSQHRSRHFIKKLYSLLNTVDPSSFTEDSDLDILYAIVLTYVRTAIDDNVDSLPLLMNKVQAIQRFEDQVEGVLMDINDIAIDEDTAVFIENEFIDRLNYVSALPVVSSLKTAISQFDKNEFDSFGEAIEAIREHTSVFNKTISMRSSAALTIPEIDFNDEKFNEILGKVYKNLTNEKRFVKTGIKRLNSMFHGGLQPGRVYVGLAVSGGFKSGLLLNIFIWGPKYNRNIRCRDQAKKPMYIYITQENDTEETLDRMMSYVRCAKAGEKYKTLDEIKKAFVDEGIINLDSHGIKIMYFPKNALCANDMENIIRDIEAEGIYEVKLIVHDYLKRLKPNVPTGDLRIDLGSATNDLSELAKLLKIPIVTANQLNREAYNIMMQQGQNEHKNDLGKKASLTMQSESQMISENADVVFAINKEYLKATDQWFLTFTDLKNRASKSNRSYSNRYFAIPFEEGNSMRLMEDEGLEEDYSLDSIADILEKFNPNDSRGGDDDDDSSPPRNSSSPRKGRIRKVSIEDDLDDD